jgi:hypothetical protein
MTGLGNIECCAVASALTTILYLDNETLIDNKDSPKCQTKVNQDPRVQVALNAKVADDF